MSVVSVDIPVATTSADGLLSAADKAKIDAGGGSGAVTSVYGRTGAVVAVSGDYNLGLLPDVSNALSGKVSTSLVGTANGVASLGSDGKVPTAQLPATSTAVSSVFGRTGAVVAVSGDYNLGLLPDVGTALSGKVATSSVGVANGVASLGSDGKVPSAQLPTVSSTSLTVAAYGTSGTVGASKEAFAIVRPTAATTYSITTDTTVKFISVVNKGTATATVSSIAIWAGASQCFLRDPANNAWMGI